MAFMSTRFSLKEKASKMISEKSKARKDKIFAEKCRMALEKSFGMPIPEPKSLSSKRQRLSRK